MQNPRTTRWPSWESLLERPTKTWSSTRKRYAWDRRQHDDLVNIHVRDKEGGGTSWTKLWRPFTYHQEHGLRGISNNYRLFRGNWSRIQIKTNVKIYIECQRLIGIRFHGWEVLCWTTELSNCQQQRYTLSLTRCFVLAKLLSVHDQWSLGQAQLIGSRSLQNIMNWTVVLKNPSCSSGKFSQDTQHCSYFRKSQERWRKRKVSLKNSKIESSSCRCTATLIGEKKETKKFVWNSPDVAAYARRFPKGHRSFLGPGSEEKWYGTHIHKPNGSWNSVAGLLMMNLRESGHPLSRGKQVRCFEQLEKAKEVE